ncbi:MAG: alanine--tRNA ligase, partial [Muribaculaceae bacterium]|nr:alanine--tRNA ligase [Muribaculaceae bacterium]
TLDQAEFDAEMAAQKPRARNAAAVEATDWVELAQGEQEFTGYDAAETTARILRYRHVRQKGREYYQIVLDRTPFYAEMGGQTGDRGTLTDQATGESIEIYDTKRENGVGVHLAKELPVNPAATFTAAIDREARAATERNHTATHLLHQALREVLGEHVEQRGSWVGPDSLRFDFSHFQKLTPDEIKRVERLANSRVRAAIPLDEHRHLPIAEAREMGAMALFGEKYGEDVRVVRYGDSIELCGGTHVANTGNIGMIRIVSESSTAAGIRRIEAVTGTAVEDLLDHISDTMRDISALFNNAPDVLAAMRRSIEENAELRREVEAAMKERAEAQAAALLGRATDCGSLKVATLRGTMVPEMVKNIAFALRANAPASAPVAFAAATRDASGKPLLTLLLTDAAIAASGKNASQIVREAAKAIKGGGGGQPGFAQAGGKDAEGLAAAMDKMLELLKA